MESFDIRDYIWNIFEIRKYNRTKGIYPALNMFITNVAFGYAKYKGALFIHYKDASEEWNDLTEPEKDIQRSMFKKVMYYLGDDLYKAWSSHNRMSFYSICYTDISKFDPPACHKSKNKRSKKNGFRYKGKKKQIPK